jgi:hypothetical protein
MDSQSTGTTSTLDLDSDTETQSQMGDEENTLDKGDNLARHYDDLEGQEHSDSPSLSQKKPFSGLIASLANIEDNIIHMTRSATAKLDLFMVAPPKVVSLEEDCMLSPDAMLTEL